jgi:hypothetical protein
VGRSLHIHAESLPPTGLLASRTTPLLRRPQAGKRFPQAERPLAHRTRLARLVCLCGCDRRKGIRDRDTPGVRRTDRSPIRGALTSLATPSPCGLRRTLCAPGKPIRQPCCSREFHAPGTALPGVWISHDGLPSTAGHGSCQSNGNSVVGSASVLMCWAMMDTHSES